MDNKPKLSFYTNIPTPYQLSFFRELAKLFHLRVIYYSLSENNRNWNFKAEQGYETVVLQDNLIARLFQKKVVDFHFSWKIFGVTLRDPSDYVIIMGNYWIPNAAAALVFNKIRGKKIFYFSEPIYQVSNPFKFFGKWLCLRMVNLCCDAILCIGRNAGESFDHYGVRRPKHMVPYSIDSSSFRQLDLQKLQNYRDQYKKEGEVVILTSGALIRRKGMDILIEAVKGIEKVSVKLIIIGDGPLRKELTDLCAKNPAIIFAGFQEMAEIPYFYAIADVFAFASRYDGWAVVINEAIAANVPIISSNQVGAALEMISADNAGILCQSENVAEFRNAIENLATDQGLRKLIKQNSSRLIPLISSDYNAQRVHDICLSM